MRYCKSFKEKIKRYEQIGQWVKRIREAYGDNVNDNKTLFDRGSQCLNMEKIDPEERQLLSLGFGRTGPPVPVTQSPSHQSSGESSLLSNVEQTEGEVMPVRDGTPAKDRTPEGTRWIATNRSSKREHETGGRSASRHSQQTPERRCTINSPSCCRLSTG